MKLRVSTVLAAAVVAAVAVSAAAAASSASIDLLHAFRRDLPALKRASGVPVLLPRSLRVSTTYPRVFAGGGVLRGGWILSLAADPRCGGANACFIASFEGRRGGSLPDRPNVRLRDGTRAVYRPISCGASCAPASLWFVRGGVLYGWQVKSPPRSARAALVAMANEALLAGPR